MVDLDQVVNACRILDQRTKDLETRITDIANRVLALESRGSAPARQPISGGSGGSSQGTSFPRTDTELAAQGYEFKNKGTCKGCRAEIEWWTTPKGKSIPLDAGTLEPHWSNCPNAGDFRK
jgi:hypothetical protein